MFLKICGITRLEDARHAVEQGATALGFVFWAQSPRFITFDRAAAIIAQLPSSVMSVGVFVDESLEGIRHALSTTGVAAVQLHGAEPPAYADALTGPLLRSVTLHDVARARAMWPPRTTLLLDASDSVRRGGTGTRVDWTLAAAVAREVPVVLAGGLTPQNVADAIRLVRPRGVDVSSGVEASPGVKDVDKVTAFLVNARRAFVATTPHVVER